MSAIIEHTAESLFEQPPSGPWELVRGELRLMSPAGSKHGWVILNVAGPIREFVRANSLGYVFGAETGFKIESDPDTVRAPDVAFVKAERVAGELPDQFFPGPPDLAVEVLSPSDSASDVQEKSEQWLESGCAEVWLIDPRRKTGSRCTRSDGKLIIETVTELGTDVLPGFSLSVQSIFE